MPYTSNADYLYDLANEPQPACAEDAPPPRVTRNTYIIPNHAWPVSIWLKIIVDEADASDRIVQIDLYADDACVLMLGEDCAITDFPRETQKAIWTALSSAQSAKSESERFARLVESAVRS